MGNSIECELEGVANSFATPSLKLRRPRDLRLEAVPHHKIHYVQTAINQVIIFQTTSLNSNSLYNKRCFLSLQPTVENHQFLHKKGGEANLLPLPKFLGIICFSSCRTLIDLGKQLSHLIDLQYVIIGCI